MEYLAEIYHPDRDGDGVAELEARLREAAEELNRERLRVRCLRSIFVPADETCFFLFEAESEAAVESASGRAQVALVRVAEAVSSAWTPARPEPVSKVRRDGRLTEAIRVDDYGRGSPQRGLPTCPTSPEEHPRETTQNKEEEQ